MTIKPVAQPLLVPSPTHAQLQRPIVDIQGLTIGYHTKYGDLVHVLRDVSLQLQPGETLGLVGESGCGKSTLGQAMMGYLRAGSQVLAGKIYFQANDIFGLSSKALESIRGKAIALIPQNAGQSLTPTMRVGKQIVEALELNANMTGRAARERAIDLLGLVRLPEPAVMARRYPHELSGGQQQRVAIAMALAGEPEMLVLDEPTTGLDVTTQAHLLDLLRAIITESGTAMIYISHDLGVIARVSDRVAVMYAGELIEDAAATDLFRAPAHPYTRGLLKSMPRLALAEIPRAMAGEPPIPGSLPGCAFAPRCSLATDLCDKTQPTLQAIPQSAQVVRCHHFVRCHHWETVLATDFSQGLHEAFQAVARHGKAESAIELTDVAITYHRLGLLARLRGAPSPPATVSNINLSVRRGETMALVGESGSGKSTIVRTLAGLLPAKDGTIVFEDFDLTADVGARPLALQQRIQMIFQNPDASLNPRQSVREILDQPLKLYFPEMSAADRLARQHYLLQRVRLHERYLSRFPGQLSGGEKQRVAIARAFAANPEVILCDEVTSALDVSVQAAVLDLLAELQREDNTTYIFITHDLAVVRAFADRVAVLYQGRLCEVGPVDAIYTPPFHPYTETLLGAALEPDPAMAPLLLAGDTPESSPPAQGCPFQRRCPRHCGTICDVEMPPWQADPAGHQIRCHIPLDELRATQLV